MILQALYEYYQRKRDDMPPLGYEYSDISFEIIVGSDGAFVDLLDVREQSGKWTHGVPMLAPAGEDRPGANAYKTAFLLWDHPRYVLGIPPSDAPVELERAPKRLQAFLDRISACFPNPPCDEGVLAVTRFYQTHQLDRLREHPSYGELIETNGNITFRLSGDTSPIFQRPTVVAAVCNQFGQEEGFPIGQCLITGERGSIARLHRATPIHGSQSTAKLHSFNERAFESYGKDDCQGENAPVSRVAAFAYTAALNYLLRNQSRQNVRIADSTVIFWAKSQHSLEDAFARLFGNDDNPDATEELRALLKSIHTGSFHLSAGGNWFNVLELAAPSNGRLTVRYWKEGPLDVFGDSLRRWFDDLAVIRQYDNDPEHLSINAVLSGIGMPTTDHKKSNCSYHSGRYVVPPQAASDLVRAIFADGGLPYPIYLLGGALIRCRAEQAKKDRAGRPVQHMSYVRAAGIKAYLNSWVRYLNANEKEFTVALDTENMNAAYRLGRLFAAYERVQHESAGREPNRSIRDAFFGSAMATPALVFPRLIRLNQHHMRELRREKPGLFVVRDRLIGEIASEVDGRSPLPRILTLQDQGRFALGYYHQRQEFFKKSEAVEQSMESNT